MLVCAMAGLNFTSKVRVISSTLLLATVCLYQQQSLLAKHAWGVRKIKKLCNRRMAVMFIPKDQALSSA